MDTKRREFFKVFGAKTAAAATAVVTPTVVYAEQFSDEIKKLSGQFNEKLSETASALGDRIGLVSDSIGQVSDRVDAASLTMAYQQAQLHLIFLLLFISFVIDGGMSLTWLMLN